MKTPHVGLYDCAYSVDAPESYCVSPSGNTAAGFQPLIMVAVFAYWQVVVVDERPGRHAISPAAATTGSLVAAVAVLARTAAAVVRPVVTAVVAPTLVLGTVVWGAEVAPAVVGPTVPAADPTAIAIALTMTSRTALRERRATVCPPVDENTGSRSSKTSAPRNLGHRNPNLRKKAITRATPLVRVGVRRDRIVGIGRL